MSAQPLDSTTRGEHDALYRTIFGWVLIEIEGGRCSGLRSRPAAAAAGGRGGARCVSEGSAPLVSGCPTQIDTPEHGGAVRSARFGLVVALQWGPHVATGAPPPCCPLPSLPGHSPPSGAPHPLAPLQRGSGWSREWGVGPRHPVVGGGTGLAVGPVAFPQNWEVLQAVLLAIRGDP